MRNYVQFWCQGFDVYESGNYNGVGSAVGGTLDEMFADRDNVQAQIMGNPGNWTFLNQYPPTRGYMLNDKSGIIRFLRGIQLGISTLVRGPAPDYALIPPEQQVGFRFAIESPRGVGWKDFNGTFRPPTPGEKAVKGKVKPTTITGIWIIVRQGLYFAGFEAGTGDPVFVRFLFGTVSAHLYLTQAQADTDAKRIIKLYKRPDIPVDVIEI